MTKALKNKDVAGKTPEDSQTQDASNRPLWSRKINRVDCSIWPHDQKDGGLRHTVAISRSYLDRETNKWKRSFYFDVADLPDVVALCAAAEEEILRLRHMTTEAGQD